MPDDDKAVDRPGGHDWSTIEALVRKGEASQALEQRSSDLPLARVEERIEALKTQRVGVVGKFKAGLIDSKAALAEIRELTQTRLEATRHALKRALEVDNKRVDLIAQKYIYQFTEEHLRDMRDMGLRNYDARFQTLMRLNEQTASLLKQAESQDVPAPIKQKTIDAIFNKYDEFHRALTADEAQLDKR